MVKMESVVEKHHLRGLVVEQLDENTVMVLMPDNDLGFDFVSVKTNGRKYERGQEIFFYKQVTTKAVIRWDRIIGYSAVIVLIILYFWLR